MKDSLMLGIWRLTVPIPARIWKPKVSGDIDLSFMSEVHHRIRKYVVREIPRLGKPISPERLAKDLSLEKGKVVSILDELERRMTFLFRNDDGAVTWAYPVTTEPTPHQVTFSSGEQIHAA